MSPNAGREGDGGVWANKYSFAQGAQINFGDQTPYLTYLFNLSVRQPSSFSDGRVQIDPGLYPATLHPPPPLPSIPLPQGEGEMSTATSHPSCLPPNMDRDHKVLIYTLWQGWSNVNHGNH